MFNYRVTKIQLFSIIKSPQYYGPLVLFKLKSCLYIKYTYTNY